MGGTEPALRPSRAAVARLSALPFRSADPQAAA